MRPETQRYLATWLEYDRKRWLKAIKRPQSAHQTSNAARRWREQTLFDYAVGYTHAFRWLAEQGLRRSEDQPEARWTPKTLHDYASSLKSRGLKSTTIHAKLVAIDRVLSKISPRLDREFITKQLKKISRNGDVDRKTERLRETQALLNFGIALMDSALKTPLKREHAIRYRTGLQIALLALRPLRLKNFAALEIGKHIVPHGCEGQYRIKVKGGETKKAVDIDQSFPKLLTPYYETYISIVRPKLIGRYKGNRLWASSRDGPLGANGLYKKLVSATEGQFHVAINPHLFRDCLATSLALNDPSEWDKAHRVLGNTKATVDRHYSHSTTHEAGLCVTNLVEDLIDST